MKNIPGTKFEIPIGESRYGEKISKLRQELAALKSKLKVNKKRLELAELRVKNLPGEIELEKRTDAPSSHPEAEMELMLHLQKSQGAIVESLEEKIKETEKSIDELTALEEHFRGQTHAKA